MTGALSVFDSPWYCFTFEFHYLAVIAGCSIVPRFMEWPLVTLFGSIDHW